MKKKILAAIALGTLPAACTNGQVGSYPLNSKPPASQAKLQFAAGVATYVSFNSSPPELRHDLNLVETLRNPDGTSGAVTDISAITGPANYVAGNGPPYDGGNPNQIYKTLNNYPALGYGFGALIGPNGGPLQVTPLQLVGGPPAWPGTANTGYPANFAGFGLGFVVFGSSLNGPNTVVAGNYDLQVAFTTSPQELGNFPIGPAPAGSLSANATVSNVAGLPLPANPTFVPDGVGGGTFQVSVPAGVSETILLLQVANQCYSGAATPYKGPGATVFAVVSTTPGPGTQSLILPPNLGPVGNKHTLCTSADNAAVGVTGGTNVGGLLIQADYPLYEASYPLSHSQTPELVGSAGQADVAYLNFSAGEYP